MSVWYGVGALWVAAAIITRWPHLLDWITGLFQRDDRGGDA
ncbi:hypothetical protein ACFY97_18420 [Streptomyces klenkii]